MSGSTSRNKLVGAKAGTYLPTPCPGFFQGTKHSWRSSCVLLRDRNQIFLIPENLKACYIYGMASAQVWDTAHLFQATYESAPGSVPLFVPESLWTMILAT